MENKFTYLEKIIGKVVTKTEINSSTIIAMKKSKNDSSTGRMTLSLQLFLEDYLLTIYNPITIIPQDKELRNFIGLRIVSTEETGEEAKLIFDNEFKIIVNMRDDVYFDPEAMTLSGPNNFCVVWN